MSLLYFLFSFLVMKVYPHGQMSSPRLRGCSNVYKPGTLQEYCSEYGDFGPQGVVGEPDEVTPSSFTDFIVCRNKPREEPYVQVEAGKTLKLTYFLQAPHPGDCALYVSYDDDSVTDGNKKFALIWEKKDCLCFKQADGACSYYPAANKGTCPSGCPEKRVIEATIPDWLPAGVAVFHHNWYATHPRESGAVAGYKTVELYTGCFDATVVNKNTGYSKNLINGTVKIPEVLPKLPAGYRANFDRNGFPTFGEMATHPNPTSLPTQSPTVSKIIEGSEAPTIAASNPIDPSSGKNVQPYIYVFVSMVLLQILSMNI